MRERCLRTDFDDPIVTVRRVVEAPDPDAEREIEDAAAAAPAAGIPGDAFRDMFFGIFRFTVGRWCWCCWICCCSICVVQGIGLLLVPRDGSRNTRRFNVVSPGGRPCWGLGFCCCCWCCWGCACACCCRVRCGDCCSCNCCC